MGSWKGLTCEHCTVDLLPCWWLLTREIDHHAQLQDSQLAEKSQMTECDCSVSHQQQEQMLVDLLYSPYHLNQAKPTTIKHALHG